MADLRRDAARNRERILDAARELCADGSALQLNAVARRAEVGVGTVYRHFATPEALAEGLAAHRFEELIELAARDATAPDAGAGLRHFLTEALRVYVDDPAFAAASMATAPARAETRALRGRLVEAFAVLVDRASAHLRAGLDAVDLMVLLCGLAYALRLRQGRTDEYLDGLLTGVLR